MGLFNKRNEEAAESLVWQPPTDPKADYYSALEYLIGLSDEDYDKLLRVALINRTAQRMANDVLGKETQPTSVLDPNTELVSPEINHIKPKTILDDEDADIAAILDEPDFIETPEQPKKTKKRSTPIEVKG